MGWVPQVPPPPAPQSTYLPNCVHHGRIKSKWASTTSFLGLFAMLFVWNVKCLPQNFGTSIMPSYTNKSHTPCRWYQSRITIQQIIKNSMTRFPRGPFECKGNELVFMGSMQVGTVTNRGWAMDKNIMKAYLTIGKSCSFNHNVRHMHCNVSKDACIHISL